MELRLPGVRRGALRSGSPAHPVVGRGQRRRPPVVPAQRLARRARPDRGLPRAASARRPYDAPGGGAGHRRRAGPHARPAAAARGPCPAAVRHARRAQGPVGRHRGAADTGALLPGGVACGAARRRSRPGGRAVLPCLRRPHHQARPVRGQGRPRARGRLPADRRARRRDAGVPAGCAGADPGAAQGDRGLRLPAGRRDLLARRRTPAARSVRQDVPGDGPSAHERPGRQPGAAVLAGRGPGGVRAHEQHQSGPPRRHARAAYRGGVRHGGCHGRP
ncbi:hypothetical protein SGPA1_21680 [Streptomyces misionensis JCM 4497]